MSSPFSEYGLWQVVLINSLFFIIFAASFIKPKTKLDWRSLGAFSAFIFAMFTEMYGFPFTIYFLSGWLQSKYPQIDIFSHDNGHIWQIFFGMEGNPHFHPVHLISNIMIFLGMVIVFLAWKTLHAAQKRKELATSGLYSIVRHPQYVGFLLIMVGFLLMWPTLLTLVMFPVMVVVYYRLALQEEKLVQKEFRGFYKQYADHVPAFVPRIRYSKRASF